MRKILFVTLATAALVILQRRAARMGFMPALLLTAAAEKGLGLLEPGAPLVSPKPSLWRRLFPARPVSNPPKE